MLYYLFQYLQDSNFPGAGLFDYISFRAALSILTSLIVSMLFGKKLINFISEYMKIKDNTINLLIAKFLVNIEDNTQ